MVSIIIGLLNSETQNIFFKTILVHHVSATSCEQPVKGLIAYAYSKESVACPHGLTRTAVHSLSVASVLTLGNCQTTSQMKLLVAVHGIYQNF